MSDPDKEWQPGFEDVVAGWLFARHGRISGSEDSGAGMLRDLLQDNGYVVLDSDEATYVESILGLTCDDFTEGLAAKLRQAGDGRQQ